MTRATWRFWVAVGVAAALSWCSWHLLLWGLGQEWWVMVLALGVAFVLGGLAGEIAARWEERYERRLVFGAPITLTGYYDDTVQPLDHLEGRDTEITVRMADGQTRTVPVHVRSVHTYTVTYPATGEETTCFDLDLVPTVKKGDS